MPIKIEDIKIIENDQSITLKEMLDVDNIIYKFIQSSLIILEPKLGAMENILIREDLLNRLSSNVLNVFGGNKKNKNPVFARIINANNNNYNMQIIISWQSQEPPPIKMSFFQNIKNFYMNIFNKLK